MVFRSICIFHVCSAVSSTHAFHPFDSRPFIMCLMTRRPPVTFSQFSNQLFHALAIRSLFKRRKPWRAISNAGLLFSASSTWRFTRTARILLTCPELAASALRIEPVRLGGAGVGVGVTAGSTASHVLVGLSCFTSFLSSPLAARRFQPFLSGVRPVFGLKVAPSSSASARLRSASAAIASRFALMSDDWRKSRSCGAAAAASFAPLAAASPSAPGARVAIASLARPSDASAKRTDRFGNRRLLREISSVDDGASPLRPASRGAGGLHGLPRLSWPRQVYEAPLAHVGASFFHRNARAARCNGGAPLLAPQPTRGRVFAWSCGSAGRRCTRLHFTWARLRARLQPAVLRHLPCGSRANGSLEHPPLQRACVIAQATGNGHRRLVPTQPSALGAGSVAAAVRGGSGVRRGGDRSRLPCPPCAQGATGTGGCAASVC